MTQPSKATQPPPVAELDTNTEFSHELAFSPDSRTLLAGTRAKIGLSVIGTGTWKTRGTIPALEAPPHHLVFSSDGRYFAAASGKERPFCCWDTRTLALVWSLKPGSNFAAFSPDGRFVAASRTKTLLLCDARDGQVLQEISGFKSSVDYAAFSPDSRRLFSISSSEVRLWEVPSGAEIALIQNKLGSVDAGGFSPDNRYLAIATSKGVIRLYDRATGNKQHEWQAHKNWIWELQFTSDSKRMLTVSGMSEDALLRVWEFPSCRQLHEFQLPDSTEAISISPDDKLAALPMGYSEYAVRIWNLAKGEPAPSLDFKSVKNRLLKEPSTAPEQVEFSPDGKWLAVASDDGKTRVWSVAKLRLK